jgi:hypothetical protein
MENANHVDCVAIRKIVNPNGLKPCDRPGSQILQFGLAEPATRTDQRMLAQPLDGMPHGAAKTNSNLGKILFDEVIAKLANDVVARGLPIKNLHEREPDLCSARRASVRRFTELQNSASGSSWDANPSESSESSSSGVPANPGSVRCSTAAKAASTTSSTDA